MIITKEQYNKMCSLIQKQNGIIEAQNKVITRLKEEVSQCDKLIGLYEACITKGVQIDFPDVTGREKGEDNNDPDTDIFFDL